MASTQPLVALILGAGPRIGLSVATKFANLGYSVATVSRSGTGQVAENGTLSIQADLSDLDAIPGIFTQVNAAFQAFPSVVVCVNGALTPPPDNNIFAVPPERVAFDFKVNTIAPYVAAREAVKGWATLPKDIKKTFIYTGNSTNVQIIPMALMLDVGIGKSASASWVGLADTLLSPNGYRSVSLNLWVSYVR